MRVPTKLRRHGFSMLIKAKTLIQTSNFQLTTHRHSGNMRISHMQVVCRKVQHRCRTFNDNMLQMGSKDSSSKQVREQKSGEKEISFI